MSLKLRIACAALLAATTLPAFALRLGEIEVKSSLNQPLVAAIPLHPKNLTELDGLSVGLASAAAFTRAGLALTATDQTLRFHVVTDNNGQKLILVTSSQPVTDPYLDFLVRVNTREGKQIREFVALLNPVIASPAPAVREAPVAGTAAPQPVERRAASELPASSAFPQPTTEPSPQPVPAVPQPVTGAVRAGNQVRVQAGDTLSGIALQAARGTNVSLAQMMLALQAVNPEAFFKDNINDLRSGVILRLPTRDEIDRRSVVAAAAEVHRQYEAWRAARPQPATILAGPAAEAVAHAATKTQNASPATDHLRLAPPTDEAAATSNHPGAAGGTSAGTGSNGALQAARDTLVSLNESNADLESRVRSLDKMSTNTGKLLSLKDATIADLQHRLAEVRAGKPNATDSAPAASGRVSAPASAAAKPGKTAVTPWYGKPVAWIIAGLIVLALLVLGLLRGRRGHAEPGVARGPLSDPDDVATDAETPGLDTAKDDAPGEMPVLRPSDASAMDADVPLASREAVREPGMAFATEAQEAVPAASASSADPALEESVAVSLSATPRTEPAYINDPVDTKLDLARAYLDMDDLDSARAMLGEVVAEGSQMQKDEARRLLADVAG
ncbi:MAG: type IV pilus assembly protein FimV [Rhodanobacteraceae bacterium]